MSKIAAWFLITVALAAGTAWGWQAGKAGREPAGPVPGTAKLVAVTPSGVRVWRIDGPGLVVPYVFAESATGQLSSR